MKLNTTFAYFLSLGIFLGLASCELENPEIGIQIDDVITVAVQDNQASILADSTQQVQVIATLGSQAAANSAITFSTEEGRFAEADPTTPTTFTVNASSKTAIATLISGTEVSESVLISAKVGDFANTTTIEFARAAATNFTIDVDPPVVTAGTNASWVVTVNLIRDNRTSRPSNGTQVNFDLDFAITDSTAQAEVPQLVFSTDSQAKATVRSTNAKPGEIQLTITVEGLPSATRTIDFQ